MTHGRPGALGDVAVRVVDLSHPLTEATPVYPGDPEPRIFSATTVAAEGYNLSHVHLGTQTGTHVDAPFHFRDDGATIDRLPLETMLGPAVVVPVPGKADGELITLADLEPHRARLAPAASCCSPPDGTSSRGPSGSSGTRIWRLKWVARSSPPACPPSPSTR